MKIEKFQWELWEWNADGVTVICCLEYTGNENKFCFVLCNSKKITANADIPALLA
jgi:hypothetical protein